MRQIDIIIEPVVDWRSGRELRLRPDFEDRRRQDMCSRMTQTLDVGHLGALFRSLAVFVHEKLVKLTTWERKKRNLRCRYWIAHETHEMT